MPASMGCTLCSGLKVRLSLQSGSPPHAGQPAVQGQYTAVYESIREATCLSLGSYFQCMGPRAFNTTPQSAALWPRSQSSQRRCSLAADGFCYLQGPSRFASEACSSPAGPTTPYSHLALSSLCSLALLPLGRNSSLAWRHEPCSARPYILRAPRGSAQPSLQLHARTRRGCNWTSEMSTYTQ